MTASDLSANGQNQNSLAKEGRVIKSKFEFNSEDECATCALRDHCPWDSYLECLEASASHWFHFDATLGRVVD